MLKNKEEAVAAHHAKIKKPAAILNINNAAVVDRGFPIQFSSLDKDDRKPPATLAEFIDNSIQATANAGENEVRVQMVVGGKWGPALDLKTAYFIVRDDGPGMPLGVLETAMTLGGTAQIGKHDTGLCHHGYGMKSAIVALSQSAASLQHIATKELNAPIGYRFSFVDPLDPTAPFGQINVYEDVDDDGQPFRFEEYERGTEIVIVGLTSRMYSRKQDFTSRLIPQLGFMYREFLAGYENQLRVKLRLTLMLRDDDTGAEEFFEIRPELPNYTGGSATIRKMPFKGDDWAARLTVGLLATNEELAATGQPQITASSHPCYPYARKVNVTLCSKVVVQLGIENFPDRFGEALRGDSNSLIPYNATIELLYGFDSTRTKDGVISSENWQELASQVGPVLKAEINEYVASTGKRKYDEMDIVRKYSRKLLTALPGAKNRPVVKSATVRGGELAYYREHPDTKKEAEIGRVDIAYKFDESDPLYLPIEVKPGIANALDVEQAMMPCRLCLEAMPDRAELVAESFSPGALTAAALYRAGTHPDKPGVKCDVALRTIAELGLDD